MHKIINKKNIPQILDVKIEKLSNLGFGIAKVDGYVIFVSGSCPEDFVKIRLTKKNKNFANAEIVEVIKPSPYRVEPFCKMQKVCGACQLQFINYPKQLEFKRDIVKDTMRSIFGSEIEVKEVVPSPKVTEYRHKLQYPVSETKESKRIVAGYYKQNSHELVNIKHCPIQPEFCNEIIEFIRIASKECNVSGYVEKEHKGLLRHVVIRTSAYSRKNLVILVINSKSVPEEIKELANGIFNEFENVSGVEINFNDKKTNLILGDNTKLLEGVDFVEEKLCDKIFKIGAKTFFQVNPYCANNIFEYIKKYISSNFVSPTILDAYAGISAFGICLSDIASEVTTVEEVPESVSLAKNILKENRIKNIEAYCADAGVFFEELVHKGKQFDITVLDPPRKGCTEESLNYALKLTKKAIIYVSCNPATLARDLKYLKENGGKITSVQPFDMFPHTYHIENVAIIEL
ncbi:23S rRNA (uracil(1939)-C(5))-methyltransferase RlmD [bacterium]|nr:23S rRNA (uracil(1939)-C(5))-methyltransferase RlmD [bacterium]